MSKTRTDAIRESMAGIQASAGQLPKDAVADTWKLVDAGGIKLAYDKETHKPDMVGTVLANLDTCADLITHVTGEFDRMQAGEMKRLVAGHGLFCVRAVPLEGLVEATRMIDGWLVRYRLPPQHAKSVVDVYMLGWPALHAALRRVARNIASNTRVPKLRRRLLNAAKAHLLQADFEGRVVDARLLDHRARKNELRTGEGTAANPFVSVRSPDGKLMARFCRGHWLVLDPISGIEDFFLFSAAEDWQWQHAWDRFTSLVDKRHQINLRDAKPYAVVIAEHRFDGAPGGGMSDPFLMGF